MSVWKKNGWRSVLHRAYPKCVVRFTAGVGKIKLLCNEQEFNANEIAAGRVPAATLAGLEREAAIAWKALGE